MADKYIKIQFKADTDALTAGLRNADDEIQSFGDKLGKWSKMAAAAFAAAAAAAAAYATKLAIDGVKAAIEDQAAQEKLALTLKNVTGATDKAISSTEDWITQQGILYGITDDELRPALERMARATGDVTKSQELVRLAMDIAAGTGKSLETVTNALGKAYEGSNTALGKLGVGIDKTQLKSMTFTEVTKTLADTFAGQAAAKADTFAGKLAILETAFNEGKETIGSYILDAITPLVTGFIQNVVPAIQQTANSLGGPGGLQNMFDRFMKFYRDWFEPIIEGLKSGWDAISDAYTRNQDKLEPLVTFLKAFAKFAMETLGPAIANVLGGAFSVLGTLIGKAIDVLATFVDAANKVYNAIKRVVDLVKSAGNAVSNFFGGASFEAPTPTAPTLTPQIGPASYSNPNIVNNVTVNGAIDAEGTARTIYQVLQQSAARTGNYGTLGTSLNSLVSA